MEKALIVAVDELRIESDGPGVCTLVHTFGIIDTYFIDIKHMDSVVHKKYTGIGNEQILDNIEYIFIYHILIKNIGVEIVNNIIKHNIYCNRNLTRIRSIFLVGFLFLLLTGCNKNSKEIERVKDMDFTVCDESRMPKELLEIIDEKKIAPFKLTYGNEEYLYIVIGYGQQDRSNLSVTVDDLFLSTNAIYIDTTLVSSDEEDVDVITYPYIVVKCEQYDLPVVFQ